MGIPISLTVNGKQVNADVDPRTLLVELLREKLHLTGTHQGCDTAQCGACTVHLDGRAVKSCSMLAAQAQGGTVTTIEGLSQDGALHPMQAAGTDAVVKAAAFAAGSGQFTVPARTVAVFVGN